MTGERKEKHLNFISFLKIPWMKQVQKNNTVKAYLEFNKMLCYVTNPVSLMEVLIILMTMGVTLTGQGELFHTYTVHTILWMIHLTFNGLCFSHDKGW